jgi:protein TonB
MPTPKKPEVARPAARSFAAASVPVVEDQPVKSGLSARAATAPAMAPVRPKPVPVEENDGGPLNSLGEREAVLPSLAGQVPSRWNMRITGAAILAGVLVIGGWQVWRAFAPPKGTPMDIEFKKDQPGPAPTTREVTTSAASAVPASATPTPAPATTISAPASRPPAKTSTSIPMPDEVTTRVVNPAAKAKKTPEPVGAPPPSEAAKVEEAPLVIGFVSRPVVESSAISNMLRTPVVAPLLDTPAAVSRITGGQLIQRIEPVYPNAAWGVHGEVMLKAVVGKDGKVKSVNIINGHAVLAQAAVAAVRRWRYQPFVLNGVPIEVENTIVVNFKAPGRN